MKQRKCKTCKATFTQQRIGQSACSPECALVQGKEIAQKEAKRAHKARKEALRNKSDWLKLTQVEFNKFVRTRDEIRNLPCISCGRFHNGQWHAGHYRTTAAAPELRFNELNCHRQCMPCNAHKSGNITEYRIELCRRIGVPLVEWLEQDHQPQKWTIEELKALRSYYRETTKAMLVSSDITDSF